MNWSELRLVISARHKLFNEKVNRSTVKCRRDDADGVEVVNKNATGPMSAPSLQGLVRGINTRQGLCDPVYVFACFGPYTLSTPKAGGWYVGLRLRKEMLYLQLDYHRVYVLSWLYGLVGVPAQQVGVLLTWPKMYLFKSAQWYTCTQYHRPE
jgi:hypothetical protein